MYKFKVRSFFIIYHKRYSSHLRKTMFSEKIKVNEYFVDKLFLKQTVES